jgi:hypothetical protein
VGYRAGSPEIERGASTDVAATSGALRNLFCTAPTPTQATPATILAADAARALGRSLDTRAIESITETIRAFERSATAAEVMRQTAGIVESIPPEVTPEIIEKLSGMSAQSEKLAGAFARTPPPLPTTDVEQLHDVLKSQFPRALAAWQMPPAFREAVVSALASVPQTAWADVAPRTGKVIADAVILAETSTASEVAEDVVVDLDDLSPSERREHRKNVKGAIPTFGTLAAIFLVVGRVDLATPTLAFVAILVSIYFGLADTPDDDGA